MGDSSSDVQMQAEVLSCRELYKRRVEFTIPAVQRGLVWTPSQIVNLWDSIFRGYPIGAIIYYVDEDGKRCIIDGQQRLNAIKLGFEDSDSASLWVKQEGDEFKFMVCTRQHPWGYQSREENLQIVLTPFGFGKKSDYNQKLLGEVPKAGDFRIATEQKPCDEQKPCKGTWQPLIEFLREKQNIIDKKLIPLIPIAVSRFDKTADEIHRLFTRINRGGTPLSNADALFSNFCVHWPELKGPINVISKEFLPPSRVVEIGLRLYNWEVMKKYDALHAPRHDEVLSWKNNENVKKHFDGLKKTVSLWQDLSFGNQDDVLPRTVYLDPGYDVWTSIMLWTLKNFFDSKEDNIPDKGYWPLFYMLPTVVCGSATPAPRLNFCKGFLDALVELKKTEAEKANWDLITLMAVGCACAAVRSDKPCCMYPFPESEEDLKLEEINEVDIDVNWRNEGSEYYLKLWTTGIRKKAVSMFYYQRYYLNKMLNKNTGFDPTLQSSWMGKDNVPWDDDHVIPRSWWPDNAMHNQHGNHQLLYFSDNRRKNNDFAGAPEWDDKNDNQKEWEKCFRYSDRAGLYKDIKKDEYESATQRRFAHICQSVYRELSLAELISRINALAEARENWYPEILKNAITRFTELKKVQEENPGSVFGAVVYEIPRSALHPDMMMRIPGAITFYQSLTPHLSLVSAEGPHAYNAFFSEQRIHWEYGKRRGFNQNNGPWWEGEPVSVKEACPNEQNYSFPLI